MTPDEFLGRVRELLPAVRERAPRAEQLRHLPDETFADFQEAGLFRCLQPKRYGGFELDPGVLYRAVTEVGVSGTQRAVRAEIGGFLGIGSSPVVIPGNMFEHKGDRIEVLMTADEVKDTISKQKRQLKE